MRLTRRGSAAVTFGACVGAVAAACAPVVAAGCAPVVAAGSAATADDAVATFFAADSLDEVALVDRADAVSDGLAEASLPPVSLMTGISLTACAIRAHNRD